MAYQYLGTPVTAFIVLTILTWAAVTVSGTTQELSTTTGDTVNIPCLFGEGTLSSIFWSYNDGTGRHKILSFANRGLTIEPEYANKASLQDDYSTLILKGITVADEGTYRCDVDRLWQTVVFNITSKLNVFSLRPGTFPVISPCTLVDDFSSCISHANQSFNLTCTLPSVYPVEDTELIWFQNGKRASSTNDFTQNADGTTDINEQIQVSETGNLTCNVTYRSANGKENTGMSVNAWIIPSADTTGKNMTTGQIVGIFIVLLVGIFILLFICRSKVKAPTERQTADRSINIEASTYSVDSAAPTEQQTADRSINIEASASSVDSAAPTEQQTADRSINIEVESSASLPSSIVRRRNVNRRRSVVNMDFDVILKEIAKALYTNSDIDNLGKALGFGPAEIGRKTDENARQGGNYMGTLDLLRTWRNKQTPSEENAALREALFKAGFDNLAAQYLNTPVTAPTASGATGTPPPYGRMDARYLDGMDRIVTDAELE